MRWKRLKNMELCAAAGSRLSALVNATPCTKEALTLFLESGSKKGFDAYMHTFNASWPQGFLKSVYVFFLLLLL
jgi:hypothetical protein